MSNKTYAVRSSHGTLTLNEEGTVIECNIDASAHDHDDACDGGCIDSIGSFDLHEYHWYWKKNEWPLTETSFDILDLAGRNKDGTKFTADRRWRNDVRKDMIEDEAVPFRGKRASVQANIFLPDVETLEHIYDYMTEQGECANYIKEGCPTDHIQIEIFKFIDLIGRLRGAPKNTWTIHCRVAPGITDTFLYQVEDVPSAIARLREIYPESGLRILDINVVDD